MDFGAQLLHVADGLRYFGLEAARVAHLRVLFVDVLHLVQGVSNAKKPRQGCFIGSGAPPSTLLPGFNLKLSSNYPFKRSRGTGRWKRSYLWSISFWSSLWSSSILCCSLFLLCSGGKWLKSSRDGAFQKNTHNCIRIHRTAEKAENQKNHFIS